VTYVSYYDLLCGKGDCVEYARSGVPMEFDATHLTREGSVVMAEAVRQEKLLE